MPITLNCPLLIVSWIIAQNYFHFIYGVFSVQTGCNTRLVFKWQKTGLTFSSPRLVAIFKLRIPVCLTIYAITNCISALQNTKNLVEDFNSCLWFPKTIAVTPLYFILLGWSLYRLKSSDVSYSCKQAWGFIQGFSTK